MHQRADLGKIRADGEIVWEYNSPVTNNKTKGMSVGDQSTVFRAYLYAPDSPEIGGRL